MNFILSHPTESLFIAGTFLCAAVSALPKPGDYHSTGGFYGVVYRLLNAIVPLVPHKSTVVPNEQPKEK